MRRDIQYHGSAMRSIFFEGSVKSLGPSWVLGALEKNKLPIDFELAFGSMIFLGDCVFELMTKYKKCKGVRNFNFG